MFLSKADLFGYSPQPTFRGKSKVNTVLGGVVSLLLVALFAVGFFFVGREIVEKKNPISTISAVEVKTTSISFKDLPLIFGVASADGQFLHLNKEFNRAVSLIAVLNEMSTSSSGEFKYVPYNVPLTLCTEELLGEEYYATAKGKESGVDFALCLDFSKAISASGSKHPDSIPSLKNPYGYQNSSHLNIFLQLCDETLDPGCRDPIKSIGAFNFIVSHPQEILNISDNANPISSSYKTLSTNTFLGLAFRQMINFNINELVSDEGWILEQKDTSTFFTADPAIYNATQYSETDRVIGSYIFAVNLTKNITTRRYMKLQELIANLGGFIKVNMMVASVLLKGYSKWSLYLEITKIKENRANYNDSGVMINKIVSSTAQPTQTIKLEPNRKSPSFFKFLKALVSQKQASKHAIYFEESLKYLDLVYLKKKFEEFDALMAQQERNNN